MITFSGFSKLEITLFKLAFVTRKIRSKKLPPDMEREVLGVRGAGPTVVVVEAPPFKCTGTNASVVGTRLRSKNRAVVVLVRSIIVCSFDGRMCYAGEELFAE